MNKKEPTEQKYFYQRHIGKYNIYQADGTKVCDTMDKEEARKIVYRLNGWKYQEKKVNN